MLKGHECSGIWLPLRGDLLPHADSTPPWNSRHSPTLGPKSREFWYRVEVSDYHTESFS